MTRALLLGCALLVSGCAVYHASPLPSEPDLRASLPGWVAYPSTGDTLTSPATTAQTSEQAETPASPAEAGPRPQAESEPGANRTPTTSQNEPLDLAAVATLAVLDNPDLRVVRAEVGVAQAQLESERLIPDPTVGLSGAKTLSTGPGLANPYMVDVSLDLGWLLTRRARVTSTRAGLDQAHLRVLWAEWQTAQAARLLYVEVTTDRQRVALLEAMRALFERRYEQSLRAYRRGDLTLETAGADLTALLSATSRVDDVRRNLDRAEHELAALLGLDPNVRLRLAQLDPPATLSDAQVAAALEVLPRYRPDLLALRAGYASQEASVRAAILGQFPAIGIGGEYSRDNGRAREVGGSVNLTLPIFNGNRGAVAVERATRAVLEATYQARLDDAKRDVAVLATQQHLLLRQAQTLDDNLPELARMANLAADAYRAQNLDALSYLNLQNTLLDKELERIDLQQLEWNTRIALDTLLGVGAPPSSRAPLTRDQENTP